MNTIEYSVVNSLAVAGSLFFIGLIYSFVASPRLFRSNVLLVFTGALVLRLVAVYGIFFYLLSIGADGIAFTDDRKYHNAGKIIEKALKAGSPGYDLFSHEQNVGYFYFCGWLYKTFGVDTLIPRVINAFFSALTAVVMYKLAYEMFGKRCAKVAGLLFVLMPNLIFLSALQFKDSILIFLLAAIAYTLVVKLAAKISVWSLVQAAVLFALLWLFRKDFCLPLLGVLGLWMITRFFLKERVFLGQRIRVKIKPVHYAAAGVLGVAVMAIIFSTPMGKVFYERFDQITEDRSLETINNRSIGFTRHLRIESAADVVKLPVSMIVVLAMPLPTFTGLSNPDRAGASLYAISNSAFILILPTVLVGLFSMKNYQRGHDFLNSVMLRWTPLLLLMGISVIYMGVLRYKEQLMPFFLLWAAYTLSHSGLKKRLIVPYIVYAFSGVLLVVLAVTLR